MSGRGTEKVKVAPSATSSSSSSGFPSSALRPEVSSFDDADSELSAVPRKRGETEMSVLKYKLQALGHKSQSYTHALTDWRIY